MTEESAVAVRPDLDRAVVALGVALLSTAVLVSASFTRAEGDIDGSVYTVGVLATLGLLGLAAAGLLGIVVPRGVDDATDLAAWPGAAGVAAAGLMLTVGVWDAASGWRYVAGAVTLIAASAGYAVTRRGAFLLPAIGAAFPTALMLVADVSGSDDMRVYAAAITAFAVLATAACWPLRARVLGGAVVGALTVVAFAVLFEFLPVMSYSVDGDFGQDAPTAEALTVLGLALLLMLGWTACAVGTRHVAFRALPVAMAMTVAPMAIATSAPDHPTWWAVAFAAVGCVALVAIALRSRRLATT